MAIEASDLLLLALSVFASFFYSASEAALISIPVERVRQLVSEGGALGQAFNFVLKRTNEILTTILVGNNIANVLAASLATQLIAQFISSENTVWVSTLVVTLVILIFGEITPKVLARVHAEKMAFTVIRVLQVNYFFFYPITILLTQVVTKVLGKNAKLTGRLVTKDDIEYMVNQAEKSKTMDAKQLDLLSSILEFPTIKVKDIMVIRNKVKFIEKDLSYDHLVKILEQDNYSRYPVCLNGDLDQTIGFLHVKDLVVGRCLDRGEENFSIDAFLKEPFFVYEHMKIQAVFDYMNRKKMHLALVKDENGLVVGIVTLEDIMEEIFGEIHDEHDSEEDRAGHGDHPSAEALQEGVIVDGSTSLRDLYSDFDIKIPLNDHYSTLAGFLLDMMGNNFPKKGMMFFWEGFSFRLEEVDNFEIKSVRICDVEGAGKLYIRMEQSEPAVTPESSVPTLPYEAEKFPGDEGNK